MEVYPYTIRDREFYHSIVIKTMLLILRTVVFPNKLKLHHEF